MVATAATSTVVAAPPAPGASAASPAAAPAAPAAAPVANSPLAEIPLTLTVSGGFFSTEQFLSNLEALSRSFQVTAVTAIPGSTAVATGKARVGQQLQVTITGRTFMSPAAATAAPASVPTTAAPTK